MLVLALACAAEGDGSTSAWPMSQGDAARTGRSPVSIEGNQGVVAWSAELPAAVTTDMVLDGDGRPLIVIEGMGLCVVGPGGVTDTKVPLEDDCWYDPAVGEDGTVYLVTRGGRLLAVGPGGDRLWDVTLNGAPSSDVMLGPEGSVLVATHNETLYSILPDGTLGWTLRDDEPMYYVTLGGNGTVYLTGRGLKAVSPTGELLWRFMEDTMFRGPATLGRDGAVLAVSDEDPPCLYCVSPSGSEVWSYTPDWEASPSTASPITVAEDGTVHLGAGTEVVALSPEGAEIWTFDAEERVLGAPVLSADGTLLVGDEDGQVYALGPDGRPRWRFWVGYLLEDLSWNSLRSLVVAPDGTVVICGGNPLNEDTTWLFGLSGGFRPHDLSPLGTLGPADSVAPQRWADAAHTNSYADRADLADGTLLWKYDSGIYHFSEPVIGPDGAIYVSTFIAAGGEELHCLGPDGLRRWVYHAEGGLSSSPSVMDDGTVVLTTYDGLLLALDEQGDVAWELRLEGRVSAPTVVGDHGLIHVPTLNGTLYIVNPDGTVRWTLQLGSRLDGGVALGGDGTAYLVSLGMLYALEPGKGVIWTAPLPTKRTRPWTDPLPSLTPSVGPGGEVYVVCTNELLAFDGDGSLLGNHSVSGEVEGVLTIPVPNEFQQPAIGPDGTLYLASLDGVVHVLASDGSVLRTWDTGEPIGAPVALGGNGTVVVCHGNNSAAYRPDGSVAWTFRLYDPGMQHFVSDTCSAAPVVAADGLVYLTFGSFGICAVGAGAGDGDGEGGGDDGDGDRGTYRVLGLALLVLGIVLLLGFVAVNAGRGEEPRQPPEGVVRYDLRPPPRVGP